MASGADIVSYARQQIGDPYEWAAEGPNSFDCSGLPWAAARSLGISIPRTTGQMVSSKSNLITIGEKDLRPGDLVLFHGSRGPTSHVAIWTGQGTIIEAPKTGMNVREVKYTDSFKARAEAYRRIPGLSDSPAPAAASPGGSGGDHNALTGGILSTDWLPNPGNLTDATSNVASAIRGTADTLASVGTLAAAVNRALLPSNLIRGFCLFMGIILVLLGIWFLAREVKESSP